jgi:acyl-CoA thioester hydrolase
MIKGIHHSEVDMEFHFYNIGMMEVVWNRHFAKYFEIARWALLEKINYIYPPNV